MYGRRKKEDDVDVYYVYMVDEGVVYDGNGAVVSRDVLVLPKKEIYVSQLTRYRPEGIVEEFRHNAVVFRYTLKNGTVLRNIQPLLPGMKESSEIIESLRLLKKEFGKRLPVSMTSIVRQNIYAEVVKDGSYRSFHHLGYDEYMTARSSHIGGLNGFNDAFQGWPVQAFSFDVNSAYIYHLLTGLFPWDREPIRYETVSHSQILKWLSRSRLFITSVAFTNLRLKGDFAIISSKKAKAKINYKFDHNLFITKAELLSLNLTSVELQQIMKLYDWDNVIYYDTFYYGAGKRLPNSLIECIKKFYKEKNALKNDPNRKSEYKIAKRKLNSIYGTMILSLLEEKDIKTQGRQELEEKFNQRCQKFPYLVGLFTSAYAREGLINALLEFDYEDVIYYDTDCIKFVNVENKKIFEKINKERRANMERYFENESENFKRLGKWEDEWSISKFMKIYGKKKYLTEDEVHISSVSASRAKNYFLEKFGSLMNTPDEVIIPPEVNQKPLIIYDKEGKQTIKYLGYTLNLSPFII